MAYNAALQAATAALAACGYQTAKGDHHYRTMQSLELTIGADSELVVKAGRAQKEAKLQHLQARGLGI